MSESAPWRKTVFAIGRVLCVLDVCFCAVWQRSGLRFPACGGRAVGVEIGLLIGLISLLLCLFGSGWQRWILTILALVTTYLWFSWIAWIAQMEC